MLVATLGLGIGATSSIFSVVSAVLLRPLPYRDAEEIVRVWQTVPMQGTNAPVAPGNFADWRRQNQVFTDMAAFQPAMFNLTGVDQPERISGARMTPGAFELLGVAPHLGRYFTRDEQDQAVAVLGHGLWKSRFGADPGIVGRSLSLNGTSYRVIGVMPPDFQMVQAELWTPLLFTPDELADRGSVYLGVMARLKKGVSLEEARRNMAALAEILAQEYPANQGWGSAVLSLRDQLVGDVRVTLLTLFGAVGFVLLVTCANVANLLLARSTERGREIAIRTTLGASRRRLLWQSLTEGMVLSAAGGIAGLLLSAWGIRLLLDLNPARLPNLDKIGLDWRVVLFTMGLSLVTGIVFGLVPALQISATGLHEWLKEGSAQASAARSRNRLRNLLVISEVALALVLLIGAGLMTQSFRRLLQVDPGFVPDNAMSLQLNLPEGRYPEDAQRTQFYQQVLERVQALSGIQHAGMATTLPLTPSRIREDFFIEGRDVPMEEQTAFLDVVTPDYFRAMGIRLVAGRFFTEQDRPGGAPVVIIDQSMARRYWPGESPVGRQLGLPGVYENAPEIVGVVASIRRSGLESDVEPQIYVPLGVSSSPFMTLVVRTAAEPAPMAQIIRSAIWSVDKDQPVTQVTTLREVVRRSVSQRYFNMRIMEVFAFLALVLAVVGIHGVLSYWVSQRRQEIGIRMALGGCKLEVLRLVLGRGLVLTGIGLAVGLALALALGRLISSLLFGVEATDPLTFATLSLLLAAISLVACYLPARKAMAVDPVVALRSE